MCGHKPTVNVSLPVEGLIVVGVVQVYTGGIGSYALLMMVAASLLLHNRRQDGTDAVEASLGVLLLDFFRMYGRALNVDRVGISVR